MPSASPTPMSYAKRAAIASACIFPGAGLIMLREWLRGCIFAVPSALIIALLFKNLINTALQISAHLDAEAKRGNFAFDAIGIYHQLHQSFFTSPYWQDGKWMLLASWLLSILSSYFAGKKRDLQQAPGNQ